MSVLSKSVPEHIEHKYSTEVAKKSETVILDVLMKNEACRTDMIDIMKNMQDYVGKDYPIQTDAYHLEEISLLVRGRLELNSIPWMVTQ